ncbi:nuclease-related domain-containing protein [Blastococcus sp. LR1]|uniref:nuclease-related domain-containing protein n=1 Tax=Blastococcus sp. LR1 TaxID=2877000 RepID=UPI001CCAC03E|nr:nuclease-related domain-containing protein [Blastococcus sp. LR1]MCA0146782.1 NERD domain-containing protein [Blastococcus sp. LR1]
MTTIPVPAADLAMNRPGEQARRQAMLAREAAPVRSVLARLVGVHNEERAWRIGADGEELVARSLARLVRKAPRWRVLHSVPVGDRGSDIDHVVIGPGGVFTLNAKHHPGARIWVAGNTLMVNGARQPYVRNCRHEAERASRLLTAACGFDVPATGVVVPVRVDRIDIRERPADVQVMDRRALVRWLRRLPEVLDDTAVEAVHAQARLASTWAPQTRKR